MDNECAKANVKLREMRFVAATADDGKDRPSKLISRSAHILKTSCYHNGAWHICLASPLFVVFLISKDGTWLTRKGPLSLKLPGVRSCVLVAATVVS
jgi:hypothetical protein